MRKETSLVAEQVRLQQWADQIRDCQNRPSGMKVETWCSQHGITKANYYYRLRRVRQAILDRLPDSEPDSNKDSFFVELPAPTGLHPPQSSDSVQNTVSSGAAAVLHGINGVSVEIFPSTSPELLRVLMEALVHA